LPRIGESDWQELKLRPTLQTKRGLYGSISFIIILFDNVDGYTHSELIRALEVF